MRCKYCDKSFKKLFTEKKFCSRGCKENYRKSSKLKNRYRTDHKFREKILKKYRDRYHGNDEFRKRVLENQRKYRALKRAKK